MKNILAILALLLSTSAFSAGNSYVDVTKLSPEQRAEILLQVERTANKGSDPSSISANIRQEAGQWADLGKNVGTALVASAKEVGQGVNEFSQTPVGQITTGIIVYKVIGKDILGFIFGLFTIMLGTGIAYYIHKNLGVSTWKYENISRMNGLWISRKLVEKSRDDDNWGAGAAVTSILILLTSWVTGLVLIF